MEMNYSLSFIILLFGALITIIGAFGVLLFSVTINYIHLFSVIAIIIGVISMIYVIADFFRYKQGSKMLTSSLLLLFISILSAVPLAGAEPGNLDWLQTMYVWGSLVFLMTGIIGLFRSTNEDINHYY